MPPVWVIKLIGLGLILVGIWFGVQRVRAWHEAYLERPQLVKDLKAERDCEKGSVCDQKSEERANKAAAEAALTASTAVASALAAEEATRREAAAWRLRFSDAKQKDPPCAEWASQPVKCPL